MYILILPVNFYFEHKRIFEPLEFEFINKNNKFWVTIKKLRNISKYQIKMHKPVFQAFSMYLLIIILLLDVIQNLIIMSIININPLQYQVSIRLIINIISVVLIYILFIRHSGLKYEQLSKFLIFIILGIVWNEFNLFWQFKKPFFFFFEGMNQGFYILLTLILQKSFKQRSLYLIILSTYLISRSFFLANEQLTTLVLIDLAREGLIIIAIIIYMILLQNKLEQLKYLEQQQQFSLKEKQKDEKIEQLFQRNKKSDFQSISKSVPPLENMIEIESKKFQNQSLLQQKNNFSNILPIRMLDDQKQQQRSLNNSLQFENVIIQEEFASYRQARYTISKKNFADQAKDLLFKYIPEGVCLINSNFEVYYGNQQIYSILQTEAENSLLLKNELFNLKTLSLSKRSAFVANNQMDRLNRSSSISSFIGYSSDILEFKTLIKFLIDGQYSNQQEQSSPLYLILQTISKPGIDQSALMKLQSIFSLKELNNENLYFKQEDQNINNRIQSISNSSQQRSKEEEIKFLNYITGGQAVLKAGDANDFNQLFYDANDVSLIDLMEMIMYHITIKIQKLHEPIHIQEAQIKQGKILKVLDYSLCCMVLRCIFLLKIILENKIIEVNLIPILHMNEPHIIIQLKCIENHYSQKFIRKTAELNRNLSYFHQETIKTLMNRIVPLFEIAQKIYDEVKFQDLVRPAIASFKLSFQKFNEMMDFFSFSFTGQLQLNNQNCNIKNTIQYYAEQVQQHVKFRNFEIQTFFAERLPDNFKVDQERICSVLLNIIYIILQNLGSGSITISLYPQDMSTLMKIVGVGNTNSAEDLDIIKRFLIAHEQNRIHFHENINSDLYFLGLSNYLAFELSNQKQGIQMAYKIRQENFQFLNQPISSQSQQEFVEEEKKNGDHKNIPYFSIIDQRRKIKQNYVPSFFQSINQQNILIEFEEQQSYKVTSLLNQKDLDLRIELFLDRNVQSPRPQVLIVDKEGNEIYSLQHQLSYFKIKSEFAITNNDFLEKVFKIFSFYQIHHMKQQYNADYEIIMVVFKGSLDKKFKDILLDVKFHTKKSILIAICNAQQEEKLKEYGFSHYLEKPVMLADVLITISQYLLKCI